MLNIYFPGDELPDLLFEKDSYMLFAKTDIKYNDDTKFLFKYIEEGQLCEDCQSYIDRFGYKLHISQCSMGLKVAVCILYHPDMLINGVEVSPDVVDVIAAVCHNGYVVVPDQDIDLQNCGDREVDCMLHGYRFQGVQD